MAIVIRRLEERDEVENFDCGDEALKNYLKRVRGEFIKSSGNRRLVQPPTVLLPAIRSKAYR